MVYGEGPEEAALKKRAAALGIADRVHFAGYSENLDSAYERAGIFVLPSLGEGLPNVLLEAAARAVPIARCARNCQVVRHNFLGISILTPTASVSPESPWTLTDTCVVIEDSRANAISFDRKASEVAKAPKRPVQFPAIYFARATHSSDVVERRRI